MNFFTLAKAGAAFVTTATAVAATATSASALSITQQNDLNVVLNTLLGNTSGLSNFSITSAGSPQAFGTFTNDTVFGLDSGIVLSTGNAIDVEGPNNSTSQSGPDDLAQLDISFDADSTADKLFFQYVFGSEEFLEFAGSQFNDSFQLLLNNTNLALLPNGLPVTVNNLAASRTGPFNPAFIQNVGNETQLDGYTTVLSFEGALNPNARNTLSIRIEDVGGNDNTLDSAVLIKGGTLGTTDPEAIPTPALLPGLIGFGVAAFRKRKTDKIDKTKATEQANDA